MTSTPLDPLEDDPVIPPWSAWIGPKDITVGGYSKRAAIQGEPRRKDDF